eukprot:gene43011-53374_t
MLCQALRRHPLVAEHIVQVAMVETAVDVALERRQIMIVPHEPVFIEFGGGKFDILEDTFKSPLDGKTMPLRWFTPPGRSTWATFAMEWTKVAMDYYHKYTGIPLPFDKFDTVAANDSYDNKPNTGFGGMENWGSIFEFADSVLTKFSSPELTKCLVVAAQTVAQKGLLPAPQWPAGIRLEHYRDELAPAIHAVLRMTQEQGGGHVANLDTWQQQFISNAEFDPRLCLVVSNAEGILGVAQCWTSAFIKNLAIHPCAQGQGLGRALLLHSFQVFKQR